MQEKFDQAKIYQPTNQTIKGTKYQTLMQPRYAFNLFLCAYMLQLCTAHQCGDNPMMLIKQKFQLHGLDFDNEVSNLPRNHIKKLNSEMGKYLDCVRSVETGYFKRKRNYQSPESFETIRSENLEDVDKSLHSGRLQEVESQLFDEAFKQILRSKNQPLDFNGDNINVVAEITKDTLEGPIVTDNEVSSLIKRLLRYKLPKRVSVLNEEDFLEV